jgi:hypothetical protein
MARAVASRAADRHLLARTALTLAVVDVVGVLCLIALYVVGGPFGFINDVANALVGILSAVLASQLANLTAATPAARLAVAAAGVGAVVMTIGSALIIFDVTGWYLAGLVSAVGAALIGGWLLVVNGVGAEPPTLPPRLLGLGIITGAVMLLGLLAIPAVISGVDDWESAAWYVTLAQLNWLGTYLLYPLWCFLLARDAPAHSLGG